MFKRPKLPYKFPAKYRTLFKFMHKSIGIVLSLVPLLTLSFLGVSLLSGCTILKKQEGPACEVKELTCVPCRTPSKKDCVKQDVEAELLATADSIDAALTTLAAAQKAESEPILNPAPLMTPEGGMGGLVDIDWAGPIGPLVEKLATMTQYRVKFLGTEPAIPILVSITAKRAIIAEVLQNASFQASKRAEILVFPESHVIEVRYIPE